MKKAITLTTIIALALASCKEKEEVFVLPRAEYTIEVQDDSSNIYRIHSHKLIDENGYSVEKEVRKFIGKTATKNIDTTNRYPGLLTLYGEENPEYSVVVKEWYQKNTPKGTVIGFEKDILNYECDSTLANVSYFKRITRATIHK